MRKRGREREKEMKEREGQGKRHRRTDGEKGSYKDIVGMIGIRGERSREREKKR